MPATLVPIKPGKSATQISAAPLGESTVFYNPDPNNAVWLGTSNSVSPNNGLLLRPFGSVNWTNKTHTPWACVDTGVTSPVSILFSTDADNYSDPAGIAAALVVQILEGGGIPVPSVDEVLFNDFLASGQQTPKFDVSKYNSLMIYASANAITEQYIGTQSVAVDEVAGTAVLRVIGDTFQLTEDFGGLNYYVIIASTRSVQRRSDMRGGCDYSRWSLQTTWNAGDEFALNNDTTFDLHGRVWAHFSLGGSTVKGIWAIRDRNGFDNPIADTSEPIFHNDNFNGFTRQVCYKELIVPVSTTWEGLYFICTTSGGSPQMAAAQFINDPA